MFQKAFTIPLSVVVAAGPSNVGNFAGAPEVDFPRNLSAPQQHCRGPAPRLRVNACTTSPNKSRPNASFLKTNPIVYVHNTLRDPLGPPCKQNSRTPQAFRTSSSGFAIIYTRLRARCGSRATNNTFSAGVLGPVVA